MNSQHAVFIYWCANAYTKIIYCNITALPTHHMKFISHIPQNSLLPIVATNPFTSIVLFHFFNPEALSLLNRGHCLSVVWAVIHTEPLIGSDVAGVAEMAAQVYRSITAG